MSSPSLIESLQSRVASGDERLRVVELDHGAADEVLDALASDTARQTLRALHDEPRTPSELADAVDTSVQNLHYHLTQLGEADLVEQVDTVYSSRGNEMTVYGPTSDPLVFVGDEQNASAVRGALGDVVGGLALLGVASLLVQWGATRLAGDTGGPLGVVEPASRTPTGGADGTLAALVFEVLEPGLVFFVACLVVAALALAVRE
jgi:DNA-binding transcriptional ArsR family regulator